MIFQDLTIEGGLARDAGGLALPTGTAVGGALLIDGGLVAATNVDFNDDAAVGSTGSKGFQGASRTGGPGGHGRGRQWRRGAIYITAGSLTLNGDTITGNTASGGKGGVGGDGGVGGFGTPQGTPTFPPRYPAGRAGTGGAGGSGQGGGLYINGGNVSITGGTFTGNNAVGGLGGNGGPGGEGGTVAWLGGHGGLGGVGGQAAVPVCTFSRVRSH